MSIKLSRKSTWLTSWQLKKKDRQKRFNPSVGLKHNTHARTNNFPCHFFLHRVITNERASAGWQLQWRFRANERDMKCLFIVFIAMWTILMEITWWKFHYECDRIDFAAKMLCAIIPKAKKAFWTFNDMWLHVNLSLSIQMGTLDCAGSKRVGLVISSVTSE